MKCQHCCSDLSGQEGASRRPRETQAECGGGTADPEEQTQSPLCGNYDDPPVKSQLGCLHPHLLTFIPCAPTLGAEGICRCLTPEEETPAGHSPGTSAQRSLQAGDGHHGYQAAGQDQEGSIRLSPAPRKPLPICRHSSCCPV